MNNSSQGEWRIYSDKDRIMAEGNIPEWLLESLDKHFNRESGRNINWELGKKESTNE
jgi:hypothetical protein